MRYVILLLVFIGVGCTAQNDATLDKQISAIQQQIDTLEQEKTALVVENFELERNLTAQIEKLQQEKQDLLVQNNVGEEKNSLKQRSAWFLPQERSSPADHIQEDQIHVYEDRIEITGDKLEWGRILDSNSMDPLLDKGANTIEVRPITSSDISVGDIITYTDGKSHIIHRVVAVGEDEEGWYCITKGDNLAEPDPNKVRFEQIERLLIGIIY